MNVLQAIEARHSYRGRYLDQPVPREDLERNFGRASACHRAATSKRPA